MATIVSLAELEACLRNEPGQTRAELEDKLGDSVTFPLMEGMRENTIIERETLRRIEYFLNE